MARGASLGLPVYSLRYQAQMRLRAPAGSVGPTARRPQDGLVREVLTLRPGTSKQTVHGNTEAITTVQAWERRLLTEAQASTAAPLPVESLLSALDRFPR